MTTHEAAVVGLYTGVLLGEFSDIHEYAEKIMGFPIFTHQFADRTLVNCMKEKCKPDFLKIGENLTE